MNCELHNFYRKNLLNRFPATGPLESSKWWEKDNGNWEIKKQDLYYIVFCRRWQCNDFDQENDFVSYGNSLFLEFNYKDKIIVL